jgi:hypothetical protein
MLKKYLSILVLVVFVTACDKDKLDTKPSIELKKINGTEFLLDSISFQIPDLIMTIEYNDKEGDLGGGIVTYIRNRTNLDPIENPAANDKIDTIRSPLPDFPETSTGEVDIRIPGAFLIEDPRDNDTMFFNIFVQDLAGNISDTISTSQIVQRKF